MIGRKTAVDGRRYNEVLSELVAKHRLPVTPAVPWLVFLQELWNAAIASGKPYDCTCQYPMFICRNVCGHEETCPVFARWQEEWTKHVR